jgi:hypothetical protein
MNVIGWTLRSDSVDDTVGGVLWSVVCPSGHPWAYHEDKTELSTYFILCVITRIKQSLFHA